MPEYTIPFTQYLLPHGRTKEIQSMPVDARHYSMAMEIIDAGGRFEVEVLPELKTVSMTVAYSINNDMQDIAGECAANGPELKSALIDLIETAYKLIIEGHETV